jgi:hypothetical protein
MLKDVFKEKCRADTKTWGRKGFDGGLELRVASHVSLGHVKTRD